MTEPSKIIGVTRFKDYVKGLPHRWIFDRLISGAGGARRILSSAMITEAAAAFAAAESLAGRFGALEAELGLRCAQTYLMGGNGLGFEEQADCAREAILGSLLVFAARDHGNANVVRLFGFDEFEPALRPLMAAALAEACGSAEDGDPAALSSEACPWRPLNDVAAVCSLAMQGQLKRNAHGGLARSALLALKKLVHDPTLTGKGISEGLPGHPAGILIGFCLKESFIVDTDSEYAINRPVFENWLETGMNERLRKLNDYALEFLGGFNLELARALLSLADGRWLPVDRLAPEADRPLLARAVGVLEFLGRVNTRSGDSSGGLRFTPCKPAAADVDRLYAGVPKRDTVVMPDFSVFIPLEASPSELFEFSKAGLLTAFDRVYKGRITKDSVSNALSAGIDPAYIREWLHGRRASANVVKTIDEWMREFSRLFVSDNRALVSSDEKVTREIMSIKQLNGHLAAAAAHTVFTIRPGSERLVFDILEKAGFDTRAPGKSWVGKPPSAAVSKYDVKNRWKPLTDFSPPANAPPPRPPMSGTKYGSGLKPLDISDMIHVIDYAILTNQLLIIDYAGGANIKQAVYTVLPTNIDKGMDAAVEAEIPNVRGRQLFYLANIKRIGVVAR